MDLGDIEVIPYVKLGKDGLMGMEKVQALLVKDTGQPAGVMEPTHTCTR